MSRDYIEVIESTGRFLGTAVKETLSGVFRNRVPLGPTLFGMVIAVGLITEFDVWLFKLVGFATHMKPGVRDFLIYAFLASGWVIWGVARAAERSRLLWNLKDAFEAAKLKCNGRYPSLIEDVEVDDHVRKLRLFTNGITKTAFDEAKIQIEACLNITIGKILQDDSDKARIEVFYALKALPRNVVLENPEGFGDGEIPVGLAFDRAIVAKFRDIGHLLVAGQTGGGKSNFLKVATTVLTRNNPDADVLYLDFKGGMETADLRNHAENLGPNIRCFDGEKECADELSRFNMALEDRFQAIASRGANSLDEYLKMRVDEKTHGGSTLRTKEERRTYIIIDEIAQLYSKTSMIPKDVRERAQSAVNRISRQGRAAGLHLIVATQKADSKELDQTVKANLPAVVCFPMVNQVSSVSAIGTKRAFEIDPTIKGRAVWKFGPKVEEVQTYYFG